MPNYSLIRNRWLYAAMQSDPLTIATVDTGDYFSHTKVSLDPVVDLIKDNSITGSRQDPLGIPGRMSGTFSVDLNMRGSGTTLTAPSFDALLEATFGQAIATGVYALTDNIETFSLYNYRVDPAGGTALTQQIAMGATVTDTTFTIGSDIASMTCNGKAVFVLDTNDFSTYNTAEKGGLTSFPASPTLPTSILEVPVVGFTGSITTGSDTIVELKTATVKISTGNDIVTDTFGTFIGSGVQGNVRTIDVTLTLDDSDSTGIANLKKKAQSKAPFNIALTVGTIAGNTFAFALSQVQLGSYKFTDGSKGRVQLEFSASTAHGTTLAGLDALTLTCL